MDKSEIIKWLQDGNECRAAELLDSCKFDCHYVDTGFPSNGGAEIHIMEVYIYCSRKVYEQLDVSLSKYVEQVEKAINVCFEGSHGYARSIHWLADPSIQSNESTLQEEAYQITNEKLLEALELQKSLMISVSTGGTRIEDLKQEYKKRHQLIDEGLSERNITDANPFKELWDWYGKWSAGELKTYQSRREYISEMFDPTIDNVRNMQTKPLKPIFEEPTGWARVDRGIGEIKVSLLRASNEEQYQTIGLLCRETLISLGQVVFDKNKHSTEDEVEASKTDANRMLSAYISSERPGKSNENIRRHGKASLCLANDLAHRRTADFRLAAMCAEATNSVVNIIAIMSGRRDPK